MEGCSHMPYPPPRGVSSTVPPYGSRDAESAARLGTEEPQDKGGCRMDRPHLTPHIGGPQITANGELVMAAIRDVLIVLLPTVPRDDPFRAGLEGLACAAGCPPRVLQARLEAV